MPDLMERFWAKVDKSDACWVWTGSRHERGYGVIYHAPGRNRVAHRVAYEALVGPVPVGLELDHLCRNPSCVNPAHLEPVTHQENCRRGKLHHRRTHCQRGHELTPENTSVDHSGRHCKVCARIRNARYYRIRANEREAMPTAKATGS